MYKVGPNSGQSLPTPEADGLGHKELQSWIDTNLQVGLAKWRERFAHT